MERDVRYCATDDGGSIAYRTLGEGQPLVVTSRVLWSHLQLPPFREYHQARSPEGLGRGLKIVLYDARGTGLSGRDSLDFSLDAQVHDLEVVVERLKLTRFAVFGALHGGAAAIAYVVRHPERVSHLVLLGAYARGRDVRHAFRHFDSWAERAHEQWEQYTLTIANSNTGFADHEWARKLASRFRESMTPESVRAFLEAQQAIDVTMLLPLVAVPTLVMQGALPENMPQLEWSRELASKIPDAHFVTVANQNWMSQGWTVEETRVVEDFLGVSEPSVLPSGLTQREIEVLRLIVLGKSGRDIAAGLVLSQRTVERHVANIYRKTATHGRAQLVGFALRRNLV
jgi:pimeloyl-ACP methyl ester carboxylesterase